jgi:PAS domain S-box-containing protein
MKLEDRSDSEVGGLAFPKRDEFRSLVFETSPLPMVVMDVQSWQFIDCNPAAVAIYGYASKDEVMGKTFVDVLPAQQYDGTPSADRTVEHARQALQDGSGVFEWLHRRPSGELWDAQIRLLSLAIPGRRLLHFSLVDITSRRRAERVQRLQHELVLALNSCSDLNEGASLVLHAALELDKIDCGAVYVADARDGSLQVAASDGLSLSLQAVVNRFTAESPATGVVVRGDVQSGTYAEYHDQADAVGAEASLRGFVLIPIMFNGQLIALLCLASQKTDEIPTSTRAALETIAFQTGATLRRLHTESALRESEAIFQRFLDTSPVHVFVKDQELRAIKLSANFEQMLGRPMRDILGKRTDELFPPEMAASIDSDDREVLAGRKVITVDEAFNGRHYTTIKFPIDIAGTSRYLAGYSIDVTDRKLAEQALEQTTEQFRAFMNNMPSMAIIKDEELRPVFFNRAMLDAVPAKDWLGKTPHESFPASVADQVEQADTQALREGSLVSEEQWTDRTGAMRILEARRFTIRRGDAPPYLAAIITDITDRRRSEVLLQNTQKLEALGVLAGGIAHDFNNLLGGIFGYLDLARLEDSKEERDACFEEALSVMGRARDLTRQLLTFAKGGAPVKKVDALTPFLQTTVQFALSGASVDCHLDIPADLWTCDYDKNQIGQAIDNLVINAVQAMPSGGTIEVAARNVIFVAGQHAVLPAGSYVRISIIDHGVGITRESLPRVFDPFFTTKPKGHGLGLATCYSIVKRHGGCIEVDSELGKGSAFHVLLPAAMAPQAESGCLPRVYHRGEGIFVVMDDEDVVRDLVARLLGRFGYTVVGLRNGNEVLEYYTKACETGMPVAGMIFDLTIPGAMGGKEAVTEIRKLNSRVPVFVASGYADDPVMAQPQRYGFTSSIAKPFTSKELGELLNAHVI